MLTTETRETLPAFDDWFNLFMARAILEDESSEQESALRVVVLEELLSAVSAFLRDSTIYDGTNRESKFKLALLKHRLPLLKEIVVRLEQLPQAS